MDRIITYKQFDPTGKNTLSKIHKDFLLWSINAIESIRPERFESFLSFVKKHSFKLLSNDIQIEMKYDIPKIKKKKREYIDSAQVEIENVTGRGDLLTDSLNFIIEDGFYFNMEKYVLNSLREYFKEIYLHDIHI